MDILVAVVLTTNAIVITIALYEYWKFKHALNNLNLFSNKKMEELSQILHEQSNENSNETSNENSTEAETYINDRLMAVVVGGKAMHYLGKDYTVKEIEQLNDAKRK